MKTFLIKVIEKRNMRVGVLFSGGKDSCLAMNEVLKKHDVVCLISIISKNPDSFMFHTPNINLVELQARAMELPLIQKTTRGEKEKELKELEEAIREAKNEYKIKGIITGAIKSVYQSSRIQKICDKLKLKCFNPLWQMNEEEEVNYAIKSGIKFIISRIASYPLEKRFLGREYDFELLKKLKELQKKCYFSLAGEGGELETFVFDAPFFKKKVKILEYEIRMENEYSGNVVINKAVLVKK